MTATYLIPRALYLNSEVPNQPAFDTLIGICNPYEVAQNIELRFYGLNGVEVPNSPLMYRLEPGHSLATTLIKNNIFSDPPQEFQGYGKIVMEKCALPATCCLGGNGPSPLNWNYLSPNVPLVGADCRNVEWLVRRLVFPYLIPYFMDPAQHFGDHEYRTGLSITNLDDKPAELSITYTVGDVYPNAGQQINVTLTIAPGDTYVKQMHELMPLLASFNSEGWLDIVANKPTKMMAYLLPANKTYQFFGFGQAPFVLG